VIAICRPVGQERPALEVVDISSWRADLARRREVKFTLFNADLEALRRLLEVNGKRQVYHREVSVVRSVYFDDARLSACRANLDGLGRRSKLRLRWYDSPLPGSEAFLEIKWREGRVTGKHRLRLRCDDPIGGLSYPVILSSLAAAVPDAYRPALLRYSEPTLLVQYQREHFLSPERRLRVTLDYGMVYYDQRGRLRISTSFGRRHEGFAVLEGKMPPGCERQLRSFLYPFVGRVARCSKYVHGCERVGLV